MSVFQHSNSRTPRWLGYLVQRPESHSVHHQRGVHAYNYSDLPLFDIVFGTFRNPRDFAPEQGFWQGASARVPQMLAFRDIARELSRCRATAAPRPALDRHSEPPLPSRENARVTHPSPQSPRARLRLEGEFLPTDAHALMRPGSGTD